MKQLDLDAIEARANAATPGPWIVAPELVGPDGQGVYHAESLGPICEVGDPYPRGDNHPQENMAFIAAAREDVPDLVAAIRRVLDLHQPMPITYSRSVSVACAACNDEDAPMPTAWPCETVAALGVE